MKLSSMMIMRVWFFPVTSSYALYLQATSDVWFADSGASDHVTDHLEWFDTDSFTALLEGTRAVHVADDTKL